MTNMTSSSPLTLRSTTSSNFSPAQENSPQRVAPQKQMILNTIPRLSGMKETTPIRQEASSRFPVPISRTMIELGRETGESMIDRRMATTAEVAARGLGRRIIIQGKDLLIIIAPGRLARPLVLMEGVEREREKVSTVIKKMCVNCSVCVRTCD